MENMEETNEKLLRETKEILKEMKSESKDKYHTSNEDNKKNQQQMIIKTEGEVCLGAPLPNRDECKPLIESNLVEQLSTKKEKTQSDVKENKSNEDREKNQRQMDLSDEKEVHKYVSLSNTEESTSAKRLRESDEIELNTKKMKSETNNANSGESDETTAANQEQRNMTIREAEEKAILELFKGVLNEIIDRKKMEEGGITKFEKDITESLDKMKSSFKSSPIKADTFHETDFTKWKNICAYLYRYGSHGAGFARYRILNAIRNCKEVENILKQPDLKVIFLGSGPGNDAVGFCSALSELQYPKSLKLTLVDKFVEWDECIKVAENFINSEKFGRVSELFDRTIVDFHFIQVDLPGDLKSDEKYFKVLGEADVIVANKFFTSLDRKNYGAIQRSIINSLHEHMKEDAVILVNDIILEDMWKRFHCIYKWPETIYKDYLSTARAEARFNSTDDADSKLPINVFVKYSTNK